MDSESTNEPNKAIFLSGLPSKPIFPYADFGEGSWIEELRKAPASGPGALPPTVQDPAKGRQYHPLNLVRLKKLRDFNPHHSTCLETKVRSAVGLGFETRSQREKKKASFPTPEDRIKADVNPEPQDPEEMSLVEELLDPLCTVSFQDVLISATADYYECNDGYIEVVRGDGSDPGGPITGLHYVEAERTFIVMEEASEFHYEVDPDFYAGGSGRTKKYARFGDLEGFLKRYPDLKAERIGEIIQFRRSTNRNRYYGTPDWISCVPIVELKSMVVQSQFDFFNNRMTPEFMLFVMGAKLPTKDWTAFESQLKKNIGQGNQHKSVAMNIANPDVKVQLEKLALDGAGDSIFANMADPISLEIVSAHRVPPLLAGIQIPGKLGATNELPNALMAFQKLVIGPDQHTIKTTLANTLGNRKLNGGLRLRRKDFSLRTITDEIDTGSMDTVSRMREPFAQAAAQGRDPKEGLKQ